MALSSNPSDWFGSLILSFGNLKNFDEGNMASFLSRILLESPSFHVSELLGFAMLMLFKHYGNSASVRKFLEQIIEISCVDESIAKALKWYTPISRGQVSTSFVEVSLSRKLEKVHKLNLPSEGMFPKRILPKLKLIAGSQLFAKG